jgi:FixJ family two-component response regulator
MVPLRERTLETVYIVDDDATFARGLARLVGAAGWKAEVFTSAGEFLAAGRGENPGCVLLDVRMPGMRGPDAYRAMIQRHIELPVIFLTGHGDVPTSVYAMKLGAVDFLEKPVPGDVLVGTIRTALARDAVRRESDRVRRGIAERVALLTPREREVMGHVIMGRLNKQIAADLGISLKTVKAHRARVMEKMDAKSVAALVDLCRTAGVGEGTAEAPQAS